MILTSNRGFAEWGEVFGDPVVATALLDRLLHHAVVVQIEGASYRLRQHADLVARAHPLQGPHHAAPAPGATATPPRPSAQNQKSRLDAGGLTEPSLRSALHWGNGSYGALRIAKLTPFLSVSPRSPRPCSRSARRCERAYAATGKRRCFRSAAGPGRLAGAGSVRRGLRVLTLAQRKSARRWVSERALSLHGIPTFLPLVNTKAAALVPSEARAV